MEAKKVLLCGRGLEVFQIILEELEDYEVKMVVTLGDCFSLINTTKPHLVVIEQDLNENWFSDFGRLLAKNAKALKEDGEVVVTIWVVPPMGEIYEADIKVEGTQYMIFKQPLNSYYLAHQIHLFFRE